MTVSDLIQVQKYDPRSKPPPEVVEAIENGLVEIIRRVEIYQSDGETPWSPNPNSSDIRLVEGQVTVEYNSAERRKFDVTLENFDQALRPNPYGGLWYDKVLKPFYGVRFAAHSVNAPLAIIESQDNPSRISQTLASMGYTTNDLMLDANDVSQLLNYQFIVSSMTTGATQKSSLLNAMFERGKYVVTIGVGSGTSHLPHYLSTPSGSRQYGISPTQNDSPVSGAFTSEAVGSPVTGTGPSATGPGVQPLAVWVASGQPQIVTAAVIRNGNGGIWVDIHLPSVHTAQSTKLLRAAMDYMRYIQPYRVWETQMGEYYIDQINTADFPDLVKITARDGTKKLMSDKLARNSMFPAGKKLRDLIIEQASLGGISIKKMRLNIGDELLSSEMTFERGTSRWDIIDSALESYDYERFFDAFGNFVVRKFLDPSTSPVSHSFGTGPKGNLVRFDKSVNDSRIYNHVIVTSPPADDDVNPIGYFGEAWVTDRTLPTHESKIGKRVLPVDASWLGSNEEAMALAASRLKITALESYELNFSSIYYPWLEVGEIVDIHDPDALSFEPTAFLLDSITYPLSLGAMSATGKRVTFVGSSGGTGE